MKDQVGEEVRRWKDRPLGGATAEDRAADLLRGCLSPREPESARLAQIAHALQGHRRRKVGSLTMLRLVLAAVALMVGAATVKAYQLARRSGWFAPSHPVARVEREQKDRARRTRHSGRGETWREGQREGAKGELPAVSIPTDEASVPPPVKSTTSAASEHTAGAAAVPSRTQGTLTSSSGRLTPGAPRTREVAWVDRTLARDAAFSKASGSIEPRPVPAPGLANPPSAQPAAPQEPSASSASEEARILDGAIALLRREHNGGAALAALDAYLQRYPQGLLNREARFVRVDALLLLGRPAEALAALETLPLDRGRRATELRVIRGELRTPANCAEAEGDFSTAMAQSPNAELLERILYGRGVCRSRLGNLDGASADLQRYLDRFPNAPRASTARQWLQSTDSRARSARHP